MRCQFATELHQCSPQCEASAIGLVAIALDGSCKAACRLHAAGKEVLPFSLAEDVEEEDIGMGFFRLDTDA